MVTVVKTVRAVRVFLRKQTFTCPRTCGLYSLIICLPPTFLGDARAPVNRPDKTPSGRHRRDGSKWKSLVIFVIRYVSLLCSAMCTHDDYCYGRNIILSRSQSSTALETTVIFGLRRRDTRGEERNFGFSTCNIINVETLKLRTTV